MRQKETDNIRKFFGHTDENGVSNLIKAKSAKIIRRVDTTDKNKSYEQSDTVMEDNGYPGVVEEEGKMIGFGIHIFNEDVYPLQSFEIYLRKCDLEGELDLSDSEDLIFVDLYHNKVNSVMLGNMPAMRILGLQDNELYEIDPTGLPACQGIDIGMNHLVSIDVSHNPELVELYINNNLFHEIDLSAVPKLKYFYCHGNCIEHLDTRNNPLLRHLNATDNPMISIRTLAPQREEEIPLELYGEEGGYVGLKFNPVYNAQWKETGEWSQSYYAYAKEGYVFEGWYENGEKVSEESIWYDTYGTGRILYAKFRKA